MNFEEILELWRTGNRDEAVNSLKETILGANAIIAEAEKARLEAIRAAELKYRASVSSAVVAKNTILEHYGPVATKLYNYVGDYNRYGEHISPSFVSLLIDGKGIDLFWDADHHYDRKDREATWKQILANLAGENIDEDDEI